MSEVRRQVIGVVEKVIRQRGLDPTGVRESDNLIDTGLKSLDLSRIVALLEMMLDVDPFLKKPITDIRTVADLCDAYQAALTKGTEGVQLPEMPKPEHRTSTQAKAAESRRAARRQSGER